MKSNKDKLKRQINKAPPRNKQSEIDKQMVLQAMSCGEEYKGSEKLNDKIAIITGGDGGISRSVAVHYAKEGAHVAIIYKTEEEEIDAKETALLIEAEDRGCLLICTDVGNEKYCQQAVNVVKKKLGGVDILVNNTATQSIQEDFTQITAHQLEKTFRTNIFSYFFMAKACLKYMKEGGIIINTTSVHADQGSKHLIDYSSTMGALVGFTRSLALSLVEKGIRVNGVASGPLRAPFIGSSFSKEDLSNLEVLVPFKRAAEPDEIAPCYVFLASRDSSNMVGQILHPNGELLYNRD